MVYITVKGLVCMQKIASRIGDFGLTGIGSYLMAQAIPGVSSVTNTAGGVSGALHENARKEIKNRGHEAKSLIPGVGAYRQGVIARAVADESGKKGRKQLLHEMIGSRLSMFGTGMLGAVGGAALSKHIGDDKYKVPLVVAGGIGGMTAPSVVAAIVALSTKTRSKKEQDKSEKRNVLMNYVPGVGDYQYMKRLGRGYDKYFDNNITKKAGDKSMSHLLDAIIGQTSEPRKEAVRNLLNKQANDVPPDSKQAVRNYLSKLAGPKCGEQGHYCSECEKYGESTECGCGYDCGCDLNKEAADYSCPSCGTACPTCNGGVKKEAGTYAKTPGQYDKAMKPLNQPISKAESTAASGARKTQLAKDKEKKRMAANRKAALAKSNTAQANYDAKKKRNEGAEGIAGNLNKRHNTILGKDK